MEFHRLLEREVARHYILDELEENTEHARSRTVVSNTSPLLDLALLDELVEEQYPVCEGGTFVAEDTGVIAWLR